MAFDGILQGWSAPASTDLSSSQYLPVIFDEVNGIALATAAYNCDGILQDNPVQGQAGYVAVNGVAKVLAGGTIAAGAQVQVGSSTGVVTQTGSGIAIGKALIASTAAGQIISILLYKGNGAYAA
jgi:Uncharacterized conserved protein (DUF2190)